MTVLKFVHPYEIILFYYLYVVYEMSVFIRHVIAALTIERAFEHKNAKQ